MHVVRWIQRVAVSAGVLGLLAATTVGCEVGVGPDYPYGAYGEYPTDAYLATTEPWYYDGRAAYWYGGRWNYREGGRWGHYDHEPAALRQRRMQGGQRRYMSESGGRGGGRGGGRSGGRSGGGGGGGHR